MKKSLSLRDLTLISSYLDDRLSPAEQAKVEARLNEDALFRMTLEEMRATRQMLRLLPQRRAPRNFTLSPEMLPRQHRLRLQPVFGWSSLATAALTVLIFAGTQWLPGAFSASREAAPMLAAAPEMQSAATDSAQNGVSATAIPPLILWNGQSYGAGAGGSGFDPTGMGGGGPVTSFAPVPQPSEEPSLTTKGLVAANPDDLILGIAPADQQGKELTAKGELVPSPSGSSPAPDVPRLLEIVFGSLTVIFAALAVLFRRRF